MKTAKKQEPTPVQSPPPWDAFVAVSSLEAQILAYAGVTLLGGGHDHAAQRWAVAIARALGVASPQAAHRVLIAMKNDPDLRARIGAWAHNNGTLDGVHIEVVEGIEELLRANEAAKILIGMPDD